MARMCFRVWGFCSKWSLNSSANLVRLSRHAVVRDWKTWILYGCMRRSVRSMRHAVEGDTLFSEANCRADFRVGDEATLAWMVPAVSGVRTLGLPPRLFSCLPHSELHETAPPTSSPYSLLVLPCTCTGFWTGAGLWQSSLFAETIPQFEFSALSLVAEPFWMTSQGHVLLRMEKKTLMYDDYGAATCIELRAFSLLYRSNKIDSNWLIHPVVHTATRGPRSAFCITVHSSKPSC
jgi:hypothetical protein